MPTQKQLEANRRNAQLSTGPKSEEGKAISSMNALKSGLDAESQFVIGESREAFAKLQSEYETHYTATNPEQRFYLDSAIRHEWLLRRFHRVEAELWIHETKQAEPGTGIQLGEAFDKTSPTFMRLHRRVAASEKSYKESMAAYRRLKKEEEERKVEKPAPQPQQTKPETPQLASFRTTPSLTAPLTPGTPAAARYDAWLAGFRKENGMPIK
jgi:plasmid maintenance system antidote protein VapI